MKTRINKTTKVVDGEVLVKYQAQIYHWPTSLFWMDIYEGWIETLSHLDQVDIGNYLGARVGTLEYAKAIIDARIEASKKKKDLIKKVKDEYKSNKFEYIKYP